MSAQPEALRLADALQQQAVWEGHYGPSYLRDLLPEAADELRRLHAQRDALLAALKKMRIKYGEYACSVCEQADAAIRAAEETK